MLTEKVPSKKGVLSGHKSDKSLESSRFSARFYNVHPAMHILSGFSFSNTIYVAVVGAGCSGTVYTVTTIVTSA